MRWYIVHARANSEDNVRDAIRQQVVRGGLAPLVDEVMVPSKELVEMRGGSKVAAGRRFAPGYVLVKCDLTDEVYQLIKNTLNVTGFLGADNKPMPISDIDAARILHRTEESI